MWCNVKPTVLFSDNPNQSYTVDTVYLEYAFIYGLVYTKWF